MRQSSSDAQETKQALLEYLNQELGYSEGKVARNDKDGFPEAADSHRVAVAKWKSWIAFVDSIN
jgi:hypothetical protein